MDIFSLCDKIELQTDIRTQVLEFAKTFDFKLVDEYQKEYYSLENMCDGLLKTQGVLGDDPNGIKILTCLLKAATDSYKIYRARGVCDEIYFATMKCFTRFIGEAYDLTEVCYFDRCEWVIRHVGCQIYRIGELEYEIRPLEESFALYIHIPSNANFTSDLIEQSIKEAKLFFEKYYSELGEMEIRCQSWLLDPQLKEMVNEKSNIVAFQNFFEIYNSGTPRTDYLKWVFNTKSTDINTLPENTSLQRNLKKHLLAGGVLRVPAGRLKNTLCFL